MGTQDRVRVMGTRINDGYRHAFLALRQAYQRFRDVEDDNAAAQVVTLYRSLSGGCSPMSCAWPVSGPWCYCGLTRWRSS